MKDTYLKIGGDDGNGSLKITSTIECLVEDPPNNSNTQQAKWSYKSGLTTGKLKDSGVRRVTILGKICLPK